MSSFNNIRFEAFLNDVEPARRDSVINSPFNQRITVVTKDGKTKSVTTYNMLTNADMYTFDNAELEDPEIMKMVQDPDHQYALLSEGNEFVLIQDFIFGKLLKPADYYERDYVEPVKVVTFKELETIESKDFNDLRFDR